MTYVANLLLFYLIFNSTNEVRSLILQNNLFCSPSTNKNETDSTAHPVPPVVGQGISKSDSAIRLKNYGSITVPSPSDMPMKKPNDTMAGKSLSLPRCDAAEKSNTTSNHLPLSANNKVPSENKHSATDSRWVENVSYSRDQRIMNWLYHVYWTIIFPKAIHSIMIKTPH